MPTIIKTSVMDIIYNQLLCSQRILLTTLLEVYVNYRLSNNIQTANNFNKNAVIKKATSFN